MRGGRVVFTLRIALLAVALSCSPATAAPQHWTERVTSPKAEELLAVQRQRLDAEVRADMSAISGFIADDVVYTHGNGERQTKENI